MVTIDFNIFIAPHGGHLVGFMKSMWSNKYVVYVVHSEYVDHVEKIGNIVDT